MLKKNIVIVTPDLKGPIRNGGVGTSCALLAEWLVEMGHSVEVLFCHPSGGDDSTQWNYWRRFYRKKNINLTRLFRKQLNTDLDGLARTSYDIFLELQNRKIDLLIFPDMFGLAYHCLQAKRLGYAFQSTPILLKFLGPMAWSRPHNGKPLVGFEDQLIYDFERSSVENSDVVQIATPWSLDWCRKNGWKLPRTFEVLFPLQKTKKRPEASVESSSGPREIVFFGRLETRKGLDLFISAVKELDRQGKLPFDQITFLGRDSRGPRGSRKKEILRLRSQIGKKIEVLTHLQSEEAIEYLRSRNAVAVILSNSETMGYTLYECLAYEIPVIASNIEPFQKIVGPQNRRKLVKIDQFTDVIEAISHVRTVEDYDRACFLYENTKKKWTRLVESLLKRSPGKLKETQSRDFTLVFRCQNSREVIIQNLHNLLNQKLKPREIVLVNSKTMRQLPASLRSQLLQGGIQIRYLETDLKSMARKLHRIARYKQILLIQGEDKLLRSSWDHFAQSKNLGGLSLVLLSRQKTVAGEENLWQEIRHIPHGHQRLEWQKLFKREAFWINREDLLKTPSGYRVDPVPTLTRQVSRLRSLSTRKKIKLYIYHRMSLNPRKMTQFRRDLQVTDDHLRKTLVSSKLESFGRGFRVRLDSAKNVKFKHPGFEEGFLIVQAFLEKNTPFRCSNYHYKGSLHLGAVELQIPISKNMKNEKVVLNFPKLKQIFITNLAWVRKNGSAIEL